MNSDQAYILHKRKYKDNSEIIKLLTREHGLVDVIARGALGNKSKFKGQLQPFLETKVSFTGRSDLQTLVDANQAGHLPACAYLNHVAMLYCNELLYLLKLEPETATAIYVRYQNTIAALFECTEISLVLRRFEWTLCRLQGYELSLPKQAVLADLLSFDPNNGIQVARQSGVCRLESLQLFLAKEPLTIKGIKELNLLMRQVVDHMVHGKTIKSRALIVN